MSRTETLAKLRRDIKDVAAEPFDPIGTFYTDIPQVPELTPIPAQHQVPVGGYAVDHFWAEEAEVYQSISGEEPQC